MLDAWMDNHGPSEQIRLRVNSAIAEAGGGTCISPVVYADASRGLMRLSEDLEGFDTSIWLLTHRDLRRNGRVQAFFDHFYPGLEPLHQYKR